VDGIAKGRQENKQAPVHYYTDALPMPMDLGAMDRGLGFFGQPTAAVDGLAGGGYADGMGAMHEGARDCNGDAARNSAHQAELREAHEDLDQPNVQKQQQKQQQPLALAHSPNLQYQPPPPPPPPQSAPSPEKRGLAQMAEGDSLHGTLPSSVQQEQLYLTAEGQEPPGESVTAAQGATASSPLHAPDSTGSEHDKAARMHTPAAAVPTAIPAQHISHAPPPLVPTPPSQPASLAPNDDAPLAARNKIPKITHGAPAGAVVEAQDEPRGTRPAAEGRGNDAAVVEAGANARQIEEMVVASLLELMHGGSAPGRSKKRPRDAAAEGGGSARKRTSGKGKSRPAAAEGSGFGPSTKKPQFDVASGASDAAQGHLAGLHERKVGFVHPSPTDMDTVIKELHKAETTGEINPNSSKRLKVLHHLLHSCYQEGLLSYETPCEDPSSARLSPEACILGWSKLLVKEPLTLNLRIREMVEEDQGGIWKKANGKYKQKLRNPTRGVYDLFRKIGAKPRFRGPVEGDPGKDDMFYYKEWEFRDDESFKNARQRLAKGFSYCPDKGGRPRKQERKDVPQKQPDV